MSILDGYMKYQVTKLLTSQIDMGHSPIRKQIREAFTYPCRTHPQPRPCDVCKDSPLYKKEKI